MHACWISPDLAHPVGPVQVNKDGFELAGGAVNKLNPNIPYGAGWAMEALLTFALVYMVYAATNPVRGSSTAHIPVCICNPSVTRPLNVGGCIIAFAMVAVSMKTGGTASACCVVAMC